jgi:hypothetical protein
VLDEALTTARTIQDPDARAEAVTALAMARARSNIAEWPGYWREAMEAAANAPREQALRIFGEAAAIATAAAVGGPEATQAMWNTIEDVCRWWR